MINIKGTSGLVKHTINSIVIAITNFYQTAGEESLLFIYKDIYS